MSKISLKVIFSNHLNTNIRKIASTGLDIQIFTSSEEQKIQKKCSIQDALLQVITCTFYASIGF
ncbi:Protein CBG25196 [Caenorhabditis briggsae]|uniref:Protein CBG25196 n=1 Tax=Caenorhabditis briggsae TaxID=6238 RepID=B6IJF5_CAEBR|nr:Protein CBG25196 [Caenorhabditis briggsae]CAS00035.1 Protein CBG25196 [Caenorhabditis briggsae]